MRPSLHTPRLAIAAWVSTLALLVAALAFGAGMPDAGASDILDAIAFGALILGMATLGVLITRHEPRNAIGWVFCATPVLVAMGVCGGTYSDWAAAQDPKGPGIALAGWVPSWSWEVGLVGFALFVPLLFPDGRAPGPRWRLLLKADRAAVVVLALVLAVQPGTTGDGTRNPFAVEAAGSGLVMAAVLVAIVVLIVAGLVSSVARYRQAAPTERLQMRECMLAAAVSFAGVFVISVVWAVEVLYVLDYALVPLAIGFAMLRYRLYDVDVIIRRTLTYACVVTALAGIYLAGVGVIGMTLQHLTGRSSTLAVTVSTLAAAAAFQPLRGRIQRTVDRRFFRSGYDAQAAVDAFSAHLREQIDLDALSYELLGVVTRTVHPGHAGLWLRPISTGGRIERGARTRRPDIVQ
jgi:hypothetical protein